MKNVNLKVKEFRYHIYYGFNQFSTPELSEKMYSYIFLGWLVTKLQLKSIFTKIVREIQDGRQTNPVGHFAALLTSVFVN